MESICRAKFEQRVSKSRHAVACAGVLIHGGEGEPAAPREPFFFFLLFFFPPHKQETESPIKNGKSGDRRGKKKKVLLT